MQLKESNGDLSEVQAEDVIANQKNNDQLDVESTAVVPGLLTLVDLLRYRTIHQSKQNAYTFLQDGETESDSLTYQELDTRARAIAAKLQSLEATGERALLLFPPGLEFIAAFFGCLYAGVVAVPAYPPRRNQKMSRLQAIVADAQASVALTTTSLLDNIESRFSQESELAELRWVATDNIKSELASDWLEPEVNSSTLAFLQYTSGSTGTPKGVMVSHQNLLHNLALIHKRFEHTPNSHGVIWLPPYHDMGLIGGVLQPLYGGFPVTLMSSVAFLSKPIRWLQAISRYKATTSGGPNFAYEMCVKKIKPEQLAGLDLSSWKLAFTGAEPINAHTLEQFATTFKPSGFRKQAFYPCYGMAENTLFVSGGLKTAEPIIRRVDRLALLQNQVVNSSDSSEEVRAIVGCGRSPHDQKIAIANPESLTQCLDGQVGEIWVSGESVAQGYWRKAEATDKTFNAYLADTGKGPFLRTGDLGFLLDDELYVTGRLKDLIIIRGRNHYPQDIELTVEKSNPALRPGCCAAFSVEILGSEQLVIAVEVERTYLRKLDVDQVVGSIRKAVSQNHELQVYGVLLLKPTTIPKTSSGKIQRHACRVGFFEDSLSVVGQWKLDIVESPEEQTGLKSSLFNLSPYDSLSQRIRIVPESLETSRNGSSAAPEDLSRSRANDLIEWLRSYGNERINSRLIDERRCIPPYIVLDFGNRGLFGLQVPPEYGGMGLNNKDTLRVVEQLGAIDQSLTLFVGNHNVLGVRPVMKYASKTVREQLLPKLATGREIGAYALTEPGAGSNPRAISARAIPNSHGGWLLEGTKIWSGSAAWSGAMNIFVQHLDTNGKSIGISAFVVPQGARGLRQGPEVLTMGMRGMVQNAIFLDGVSVAPEQLLGEAGAGMNVAQDAMMHGRLGLAAGCIGGMKRCLQLMLRYSERRSVSTGRLLNNPVTLVRLSDLTAAITTLETLVFTIAELLDQGYSVPEEVYTACKTSGPEFFWQAADQLVQLLGGRGYIENNIAPQILRDARVFRIFEGPTETLNMFLGSCVINKSEQLHKFLCEGLGVPDLAQRLKAAAAQIHDRLTSSGSSISEHNSALRWAYVRTGELATFAILLAAVQGAFQTNGSERLRRAVSWAKLQFEQKLKSILSGEPGELVLFDADAVTAQIYDYAATIGDLEQTMAGEDRELDELLRCQTSTVDSALKSNISLEFSRKQETVAASENGHHQPREKDSIYTASSIQSWSENWLAKKLKIDAKSIDSNASFADYGMDSVMAVELAQDLEDWLQHSLDATIVWNFPTIQSLGKYLASEMEKQGGGSTGSPKLDFTVEKKQSSELNEPLETDIEGSIAQELTELENLLEGKLK